MLFVYALGTIIVLAALSAYIKQLARKEAARTFAKLYTELKDKAQSPGISKASSTTEENRFIFWHKRLDEKDDLERSMNKALQDMKSKKEREKPTKYQEYIAWCKQEGIEPRFNSMNEIDHCY